MQRAARDLLDGIGDLGRGFALWATSPRLMLLGAVPALIVGVVWVALLVWLWTSIDGVAAALTPFAADWSATWRSGVRVLVGLVLVAASLVLALLSYTAVVLTVGDPFYERISGAVERRLGDPPPGREEPLVRGLVRAAGEGLRLLGVSLIVAVLVLLLGLVPVVGAPLAAVAGALLGGWALAVELTGTPFDARGVDLAGRRTVLRRHRARALGFGVATWLLFLVPFGAVLAMPAAVGGAVRLTRALSTPDGPAVALMEDRAERT